MLAHPCNSIFVTIDILLHSLQYFKEGTLRTEPPKVAELLWKFSRFLTQHKNACGNARRQEHHKPSSHPAAHMTLSGASGLGFSGHVVSRRPRGCRSPIGWRWRIQPTYRVVIRNLIDTWRIRLPGGAHEGGSRGRLQQLQHGLHDRFLLDVEPLSQKVDGAGDDLDADGGVAAFGSDVGVVAPGFRLWRELLLSSTCHGIILLRSKSILNTKRSRFFDSAYFFARNAD